MGVVMGGGVCINAMSFDAMRVRAALDNGARLWHLLVIKNLALLCIVAPVGFLLSALLAWRAGDIYAFYKACALMVCLILLWLGVGNVLSVACRPATNRSGNANSRAASSSSSSPSSLSYSIGYLVNAMLIWRILAAKELADRLGSSLMPAIAIIAVQRLHVAAADRLRRRALAAAQDPPRDAEGDHRLPGQCRDEGLRAGSRTGSCHRTRTRRSRIAAVAIHSPAG